MKKVFILFLLILLVSGLSFGQYASLQQAEHEKSHIGSDIEQEKIMLLGLLNQARQNPQTLGKRLDINLSEYKPMQALEKDITLSHYAQLYSMQLLDSAPDFEHSKMPYPEIIAWSYDPCKTINQFILSPAHRKEMLDISHTKVGVGLTKGYIGEYFRSYVVILFE